MIPDSHLDLLAGEHCAVLSTVMPDGQPQSTPIWFSLEDNTILLNTMRGFQKEKNMRHNPFVTVLVYNPQNPEHHIEIRGTVLEMTEVGALEHLDQLTRHYMRKADAHFFGDSVPAELEKKYTPVKIRVMPSTVRVEG